MAVGINIPFYIVARRRSEMMFMLSKMSCTIHSWTGCVDGFDKITV